MEHGYWFKLLNISLLKVEDLIISLVSLIISKDTFSELIVLVTFLITVTKCLTETMWGKILVHDLRRFSSSWWEGLVLQNSWCHGKPEAKGRKMLTFSWLSLVSVFIPSRPQPIGWYHPHSEKVFPQQLILYRNVPQEHPEMFYITSEGDNEA